MISLSRFEKFLIAFFALSIVFCLWQVVFVSAEPDTTGGRTMTNPWSMDAFDLYGGDYLQFDEIYSRILDVTGTAKADIFTATTAMTSPTITGNTVNASILNATTSAQIQSLTAPTASVGTLTVTGTVTLPNQTSSNATTGTFGAANASTLNVTTSSWEKEATIPTLNAGNATVTGTLTVPTSITTTSSAQNSNVTGTSRAIIQLVTNPSGASVSVGGASTANTVSSSVAGGVYNGDFSLGLTGWTAGGGGTISLSNNIAEASGVVASNVYLQSGQIKITSSAKYRWSFRGFVTGGTNSAFIIHYNSAGTQLGTTALNVTATTMQINSVDFDAYSTESYLVLYPLTINNTATKAYCTDVKLEQVDSSITTKPPVSTLVYPSIAGVTSEFVDQQQTSGNSNFTIGRYAGQAYQSSVAQQFIPTKSNLSAISVYMVASAGSPSGGVTFEIVNDNSNAPTGSVIASAQLATISANTFNTVPIFALLTPGSKYWIRASAANQSEGVYYKWGSNYPTEGAYAGLRATWRGDTNVWTSDTYDQMFTTLYSQNTNNIQISTEDTANQTKLSFGDIGLPDGATIDLERGKFTWNALPVGAGTVDLINRFSSFITSAGAANQAGTSLMLNGWINRGGAPNYDIYGVNADLIGILNFGAAVKDVTFTATTKTSVGFAVSTDGINYTTLFSEGALSGSTSILKGYSSCWVKFDSTANTSIYLNRFTVEADIDTNTFNLPVLTRTGSNKILTSVNGGSYKATVSDRFYTQSLQTAIESNGEEISKIQASAQATRDRITPVTTGVVAELVASASGALVRSDVVRDATGMWYFQGEVSAQTLTDRTPYFQGDSIAEIMAVTTIPGTNEIDHKSLGSARVPVAPEQELKFMDVLDATGDLVARIPGGIPIREITATIPAQKLTTLENTMLLEESVILDEISPGMGRQVFSGLEYSSETPEGYSIPARDILVATEEYSFSEALAAAGIPEASAAEIKNTTKIIQYDRRDIGWSVSRLEDAIRKLEAKIKSLESR